jgi:hypothetical protein
VVKPRITAKKGGKQDIKGARRSMKQWFFKKKRKLRRAGKEATKYKIGNLPLTKAATRPRNSMTLRIAAASLVAGKQPTKKSQHHPKERRYLQACSEAKY